MGNVLSTLHTMTKKKNITKHDTLLYALNKLNELGVNYGK